MTVTATLSKLALDQQGLHDAQCIFYNVSYDDLYDHELSPELEGYERGRVTRFGAVTVDTGRFTGRSPKDKYIVKTATSEPTVWWADAGSDNKPISVAVWDDLKKIVLARLNGKKLYVMDGFCGANPQTRLKVRLITEVAWMAHFFKNMFIRPTVEELKDFQPDWTIFNACKTQADDYQRLGLRSEVFAAFNIDERMTLIGGTWYGGEIKKGIFSIMNYFLPLQGVGAFHCSANQGEKGDTALFFGLSGTGKTTLSTDPKRKLIGDDEHGWDDEGVFNFEGGCYAKTINLSQKNEPDIYAAICRDALLENVVVDDDGNVDFTSSAKTENTRVSYPIDHIDNIVKPVSKGGHPDKVVFLTCDAYGVLPPVAKLTKEQAMYQFLSGYTAKVAGTELGITKPTVTFSACFGQPFLLLHPTQYADILGKKIDEHAAKVYLVNTGWTGGSYGEGHRISIKDTRGIIDAILDGSIEQATYETSPLFGFAIPQTLKGVDTKILNPRNTWQHKSAYDQQLEQLARQFVDNFERYTDTAAGQALVASGPTLT